MKISLRNALGFALSVLLLVWTFRGVHFDDISRTLEGSNWALFAAAMVAGTLIFPLRARRWRTILDPIAPHLPFMQLWRATAIGMMVTNLVPARAGELARAYALTKETDRVRFSAAFASIAVDRVFDAVTVLLLMVIAGFFPTFPKGQLVYGRPLSNWIGGGSIFVFIVLVTLYLIVYFPDRIIGLFELFARRVSPKIEARGREALHAFASGLGVLRSPRRFGAVFLWTLAHWMLNAFAFWLAFKAVGIRADYGAALLLQGLIAIGVAVPSSPGFFGVFEALAKVGLAIYGVAQTQAVAWAVGFHLLTFFPITFFGLYYFARLGMHFSDLKTAEAQRAPDAAERAEPATTPGSPVG